MVLKSDKEARLLSASKQFDNGLSRYNLGLWDSILAHNVVLHKDGITLNEDLSGASTVKAYYQVRPAWPGTGALGRERWSRISAECCRHRDRPTLTGTTTSTSRCAGPRTTTTTSPSLCTLTRCGQDLGAIAESFHGYGLGADKGHAVSRTFHRRRASP